MIFLFFHKEHPTTHIQITYIKFNYVYVSPHYRKVIERYLVVGIHKVSLIIIIDNTHIFKLYLNLFYFISLYLY